MRARICKNIYTDKKKKRKGNSDEDQYFCSRDPLCMGENVLAKDFFSLNLSSTSENLISNMAFIQLLLSLSLIVSLCTRVKTILLHPSTVC